MKLLWRVRHLARVHHSSDEGKKRLLTRKPTNAMKANMVQADL